MPTNRRSKRNYQRGRFLFYFWTTVALLATAKSFFPEITGHSHRIQNAKADNREPYNPHRIPVGDGQPLDSIEEASRRVDEFLFCPREPLVLTDVDGSPLIHPVNLDMDYASVFNDSQDLQLATAERIGEGECEDRDEAAERKNRYIYIGASPFYDVDPLTNSVPYLIPRAARLLEEIGHSFVDSLAAKGLPFHKLVVTSVLRTKDDIRRLRKHNGNAVDQSCHRYGTTFDIAYNGFHGVEASDEPIVNASESAKTLCAVLAEVLDDQRTRGACYVKYETREHCFHITCR